MTYPTIDSLNLIINNKFLLSNAVAMRAKAISEGSIPYIDDFNPLNPIETAMKEFAGKKVEMEILKGAPAKETKVSEEKAKAQKFWGLDSLEKEDSKKGKKPKKEKKKK